MGEAENFGILWLKLKKKMKNLIQILKSKRYGTSIIVDFADQGLTEESILENMSTKTYSKL